MTAKRVLLLVRTGAALLGLALMLAACGSGSEPPAAKDRIRQPLRSIANGAEFDRIVAGAGDRLLIFDFFADWCHPCKELEPVLESVASQQASVVDIYRIAYDDNPSLAELFGVRGIPFVAFVKNRTLVYSLMGLRPKETYLEAIASFTRPGAAAPQADPGVRLNSGVTQK
ncbi:MAG: thioredoxin domain-containing protein [Desulfobacterales bacterium]